MMPLRRLFATVLVCMLSSPREAAAADSECFCLWTKIDNQTTFFSLFFVEFVFSFSLLVVPPVDYEALVDYHGSRAASPTTSRNLLSVPIHRKYSRLYIQGSANPYKLSAVGVVQQCSSSSSTLSMYVLYVDLRCFVDTITHPASWCVCCA